MNKCQFVVSVAGPELGRSFLNSMQEHQTHWSSVDFQLQTCRDKYKVFSSNSSQIIKLNADQPNCKLKNKSDNGFKHLECNYIAEFKTSRERWWFLAAANCDSSKGLDLHYNLTLLNNRSYWLRHFSADEYGKIVHRRFSVENLG